MKTKLKETIQEQVTLTLPREIIDDLNKIVSFNETNLEDLVYSYIVEGIASDSRAVNRMKFTDKVNEVRACKKLCVNGFCRLLTVTIPKVVLDALMKDYKNPEDLIGETGLLKQLTKQLLERAMQAEITEHLGYKKHAPAKKKSSNSRNGSYQKRVKGEFGNLDITVPRDRDSSFEPIILPKGQSRFTGFVLDFIHSPASVFNAFPGYDSSNVQP